MAGVPYDRYDFGSVDDADAFIMGLGGNAWIFVAGYGPVRYGSGEAGDGGGDGMEWRNMVTRRSADAYYGMDLSPFSDKDGEPEVDTVSVFVQYL